MHILELPSFFPPHGGLFCLEQAKALKAMGHEVRIVSVVELGITRDGASYFTASWREEKNTMEGVEVFSSYMRAVPKAVRYNISHWVDFCEKAVDRYIRRYGKPDVLHAHCCKNAGLAAQAISRRLGIPYVITEHLSSGLYERDFGKGWRKHVWMKGRMREAYEAAAHVIPVSRELVDDLAPFFGTDYRWTAVSNIVDTDCFCYHKRELPIGRPYRFCCLAVSDIYGKGYDVLAEAWREMPLTTPLLTPPEEGEYMVQADASSPSGEVGRGAFELHIAGQGTDSRLMQRLFADKPDVHLHGHLDKQGVRELLWACDALVLPSRSEAQPLVALEALATGIPVVGTESLPSSLRIPRACLIAPVGDARCLAEKMREAMSVPPSLEWAEAVRRMASPLVVARQLTEIFEAC